MSILSGLGGLTGFLSNEPANKTTTSTGTSTSSQTGSQTYTKTLTPYQSALQAPTANYLLQLMTPGGAQAAVQPAYQQAMDQVSSSYNGLADSLRQQFLSTGGGSSGKYGMATTQANLQKLGQLNNVSNTAATTAAQLPLTAESLAQQFLGLNFGGTTTSSGTGTQSTSGTTVGPGSPAAGLLQGLTTGLAGQSNQANAIIAAMLMGGL